MCPSGHRRNRVQSEVLSAASACQWSMQRQSPNQQYDHQPGQTRPRLLFQCSCSVRPDISHSSPGQAHLVLQAGRSTQCWRCTGLHNTTQGTISVGYMELMSVEHTFPHSPFITCRGTLCASLCCKWSRASWRQVGNRSITPGAGAVTTLTCNSDSL